MKAAKPQRKAAPAPRRRRKKRKAASAPTTAALVPVAQVKPIIVQGTRIRELKREEIDLLKRTVAKNTTDDEFALFLWVARKHKLDPLTRQLHCVKRGEQMAIQIGIDGYRSLAGRDHKDFGGCDEPEYVMGTLKTPTGAPIADMARIRLWKKGLEHPVVGVAFWDEYAPKNLTAPQAFMWAKMPRHMLAKCAEALAIRKGYPELSDIYTDEEMHQADQDFTESGRKLILADGSSPSGLPAPSYSHGSKEAAQAAGVRVAEELKRKMEQREAEKSKAEAHESNTVGSSPHDLNANRKIVTVAWASDGAETANVSGDLVPMFLEFIKTSCMGIQLKGKDVYVVPAEHVKDLQAVCQKYGIGFQEVSGLPSPPTAPKENARGKEGPDTAVPPRVPTQPGAGRHPAPTAVSGTVKQVVAGQFSKNKKLEHYQVVIGEPGSGAGQLLYCYNRQLWPILDQAQGKKAEVLVTDTIIVGFKSLGGRAFDADGITPEIQNSEGRPKPGSLFR